LRLRQIALAAGDLDAVVEDLCAVLSIEVAFRDPGVAGFGLRNAVMPVGDSFLEVVSPVRDDASAARWLARRGGDCGYMVIVQSDDLDADRLRVKELGVRIVWEIALEDAASLHLHPKDVGAAILSFDAMLPPESWRWAGPEWRAHVRTERVRSIAGAELESPDPEALARRWSQLLDRPVREGEGGHEIPLESGRLRFAPGEANGLVGLELTAADADRVLEAAHRRNRVDAEGQVRIGGVRIRCV
jgi:hypothetical protein